MDERRDDWRHGVDENLASLNAGQRVWEHEQKLIRKTQADHDNLLRGDPEKDTDGVMARVHSLETEVRLLRAAVFNSGDYLGLQGRIEKLEDEREDRHLGWANITKIVVAIIMVGLAGRFYNDIIKFVMKKPTDPVEIAIEKAKHPKGRRRHVVIRQEPEPAEDAEN